MRIPVCHHYWKDGQNAAWTPVAFPVPQIEEAVKNDYVILQKERPKWRKYGAYWVIFDYRPETDVFGRAIVPISFAFLPYNPEAEKLLPQVRARLKATPRERSYLDSPNSSPDAKKRLVRTAAGFLILAALLALAPFFFRSQNKEESLAVRPQEIKKPAPDAAICENYVWLLTCPRLYVEKRCQNATNLDFREFRETEPACRPPYGRPEPWTPQIKIFREKPDPDIAKSLEAFIFGEK